MKALQPFFDELNVDFTEGLKALKRYDQRLPNAFYGRSSFPIQKRRCNSSGICHFGTFPNVPSCSFIFSFLDQIEQIK